MNLLRRFSLGLGFIAALGVSIYDSVHWNGHYERPFDFFIESDYEKQLEEKYGVNFIFPFNNSSQEQKSKLEGTETILDYVISHSDKAQNHLDETSIFRLRQDVSYDLLGSASYFNVVSLYNYTESTIVHELAHIHHYNLPLLDRYDFENKWFEHTLSYGSDLEILPSDLAVLHSPIKNLDEHVAELTTLIFHFKDPLVDVKSFKNYNTLVVNGKRDPLCQINLYKNINSKAIPTLIQLTSLLEEYGFISNEECDLAVKEFENR